MGFSAIAAFTFVASQQQASQARRQQSRAAEAQNRIEKAKQARIRREQIRQERIRKARIISQTQAAGASGSSAEAGAVGSLSSQLASNIGYSNAIGGQQDIIYDAQGQANAYQGRAQLFSSLTNLFAGAGREYGGGAKTNDVPPPQQSDTGFRFYNY